MGYELVLRELWVQHLEEGLESQLQVYEVLVLPLSENRGLSLALARLLGAQKPTSAKQGL